MRARQPWLTGRRILEVAPYGYNLYSNPHESTAIPYAPGTDPLVIRDRTGAFAHAFVERNREHRASPRDRTIGLGQCRCERREGDCRRSPSAIDHLAAAGDRRTRARAAALGGAGTSLQL